MPETNLFESKSPDRIFFEYSRDAILIIQYEPPDTGRIIDANEAAAKMHGYDREEMKTLHIRNLEATSSAKGIMDIVSGHSPHQWVHAEINLRKKDGLEFPADMSAGIVTLGNGKAIVSFHRDITDKKRKESETLLLEKRLRQAQKMEAFGMMVGGIAHDFNNLIGAIVGYSELIKMGRGRIDPEIRTHVDGIFTATDRAKELVDQISTFIRKSEKGKRQIDSRLLIKETIRFLKASLPTTIQIQQTIKARRQWIFADYAQIYQVLIYLCTNAVQRMKYAGGVLEIAFDETSQETTTGLANMGLDATGDYVEITIQNIGAGSRSETRDQMFKPILKVEAVSEETGLGIAVCHDILRSHDGFLIAAEEPGKGSIFKLFLPIYIEKKANARAEADTPEDIQGGNERVLIVDDDTQMVSICKAMLQNLGYTVSSCSNAYEALQHLCDNPDHFDLIITNLMMPGMTGIQLSEKITSLWPGIPVILCSGLSETVDMNEMRSAGIKEVLPKPFYFDHLARSVRSVLDS